jgi:TPP-dependent pyruvate/acetoin dehydrogenase alpha subunit
LIDPEGSWVEWKTKDRIRELKEAGVKLEVYKKRTEKEIRKLKERKIEHHIKKHTRNMNPIEAMIFRDNYYKKLQEKEKGKEFSDLENVLTEKLVNTHLQEIRE